MKTDPCHAITRWRHATSFPGRCHRATSATRWRSRAMPHHLQADATVPCHHQDDICHIINTMMVPCRAMPCHVISGPMSPCHLIIVPCHHCATSSSTWRWSCHVIVGRRSLCHVIAKGEFHRKKRKVSSRSLESREPRAESRTHANSPLNPRCKTLAFCPVDLGMTPACLPAHLLSEQVYLPISSSSRAHSLVTVDILGELLYFLLDVLTKGSTALHCPTHIVSHRHYYHRIEWVNGHVYICI